jgi:hypothetical protein
MEMEGGERWIRVIGVEVELWVGEGGRVRGGECDL